MIIFPCKPIHMAQELTFLEFTELCGSDFIVSLGGSMVKQSSEILKAKDVGSHVYLHAAGRAVDMKDDRDWFFQVVAEIRKLEEFLCDVAFVSIIVSRDMFDDGMLDFYRDHTNTEKRLIYENKEFFRNDRQ